ncbi:MAG: hypothetical protein J4A00_01295 [Gammaproteobacteria bacterium]|nr:hypothetical protein [Gammaproteobacteria bacterium]
MSTKQKLTTSLIAAVAALTIAGAASAGDRGDRRLGTHRESHYSHDRGSRHHDARSDRHYRDRYQRNYYRHDAGRFGSIPPQYRGRHHRHDHNCGHGNRYRSYRGHHYDSGYYLTRFLIDYSRYDD